MSKLSEDKLNELIWKLAGVQGFLQAYRKDSELAEEMLRDVKFVLAYFKRIRQTRYRREKEKWEKLGVKFEH